MSSSLVRNVFVIIAVDKTGESPSLFFYLDDHAIFFISHKIQKLYDLLEVLVIHF